MRQDKDEAFLGKKLKLVELLMLSQDRDANDKVLAPSVEFVHQGSWDASPHCPLGPIHL